LQILKDSCGILNPIRTTKVQKSTRQGEGGQNVSEKRGGFLQGRERGGGVCGKKMHGKRVLVREGMPSMQEHGNREKGKHEDHRKNWQPLTETWSVRRTVGGGDRCVLGPWDERWRQVPKGFPRSRGDPCLRLAKANKLREKEGGGLRIWTYPWENERASVKVVTRRGKKGHGEGNYEERRITYRESTPTLKRGGMGKKKKPPLAGRIPQRSQVKGGGGGGGASLKVPLTCRGGKKKNSERMGNRKDRAY